MKCEHEGCDGELEYRQDMEEKGRFGVFECNKCRCRFAIVNVRKAIGCPSLKETKSLSTTDASIKPKRRGRPRKNAKA